jgi:hypothetical protein
VSLSFQPDIGLLFSQYIFIHIRHQYDSTMNRFDTVSGADGGFHINSPQLNGEPVISSTSAAIGETQTRLWNFPVLWILLLLWFAAMRSSSI